MNKIFLIIISFGVLTGTAQITIQQGTTDWYPNTIPSMTGDITLEEGATLNIHSGCTLNMPSGSKILIKKNARLHVSGSQITGNNWLGIRCDKGTISGQDRIPYVNISDSELSGASIAFINAEDESSEDWGGAILANNADFKDNIVFLILKNYTYNQKTWEWARFTKCKFRETASCHTMVKFIYLENVDNVSFRGCEFADVCTNPRTGIQAFDSKFSITSHETFFPYQKTYNEFSGFDRVISVDNDPIVVTKPVTIADCIFTPNLHQITSIDQRMINLKGCYNAHVYSNTFNIQQSSPLNKIIAIYLDICYVFSVQDNTINYSGIEEKTYGIVVNNSGDKTNYLYRNTINQAEVGIQAIGRNRGNSLSPTLPDLGLKFLCNTITSFDEAYYIDVNNCYSEPGIVGVSRFQQGALSGNALSPNFNSLDPRTLSGPPAPENDFRNIPTGNTDVNYMVPYDATPQYFGIQYKTLNVSKTDDPNTSKNDPHCESRIPCFGPRCPVQGPSPITTAFPQFQSAKNQLAALVNDGDYEELLELVSGINQNNVESIVYTLMNATPSVDILALACENDIVTPAMATSLLVANSYGIKSYEVREALELRDNPLDGTQMQEIYEAAESISEYEELLMEIEQMVMEYSDLMNREIYYLASRDTIPLDSIRNYLAAYHDFLSLTQLIHLEFSEGYIYEANNWYDTLQNLSNNPGQLEAYNTLFDEVLTDVYENLAGDFSQLTESQIQTLFDLTEYPTYAAGYAKYILNRYFSQDFESYVCPVSGNSQRKGQDVNDKVELNTLLVYPNPAQHSITIETYGNWDSASTIEIFDLTGKRVLIKYTEHQVTQIDVSSLREGYYIVRLISGNSVLSSPLILN